MLDWSKRPLLLQSNRVWRTYTGGKCLEEWQGQEDPEDGDLPEEWVASIIRAVNRGREDIEEGYSYVTGEKGESHRLKDLIESDPEGYLGSSHSREYGASLAVLVKVLDAGERLTIQVHPDRSFAWEHFRSRFGKTEAWYILGGRTIAGEEPYVLFGFKPGVTREKWQQLFEAQDIEGMLGALHRIPVKPGDLFLVEGGIPHAIGSGCFLIEIQEPTDLTLRTERTTPRGMQLSDQACHQGIGFERMMDCFTYNSMTYEETMIKYKLTPKVLREEAGGTERELIGREATDRFRMNGLEVHSSMKLCQENHFITAIIEAGVGCIHGEYGEIPVSQGDTFFIPAGVKETEWVKAGAEPLRVVLCYPPSIES